MSFLHGDSAGALAAQSPASSGLGHLLDVEPSRVSMIADRIGKAANGIAAAGGADQGYGGQAAPTPINFLQSLDPRVMQALSDRFAGASFNPRANTVDYQ